MSREHYVTRGALPAEYVEVTGQSPLPENRRTVHIDDLVAKTLCRKHNQALSHLDQAFIDLVNCVRETERLREIRRGMKGAWYAPVRFVVDGPRIERCVLKMALNYAVVLRGHLADWNPPDWMSEVVFGNRKLVEGGGLAMIVRKGDKIVNSERIRFAFGTSDSDGLPFSALVELRQGWRLLCSWNRPISSLSGELHLDGEVYFAENLLFHPNRVNFDDQDQSLGMSLGFDWSGRWCASRNANVVNLRKRYKAPPRKGK